MNTLEGRRLYVVVLVLIATAACGGSPAGDNEALTFERDKP